MGSTIYKYTIQQPFPFLRKTAAWCGGYYVLIATESGFLLVKKPSDGCCLLHFPPRQHNLAYFYSLDDQEDLLLLSHNGDVSRFLLAGLRSTLSLLSARSIKVTSKSLNLT